MTDNTELKRLAERVIDLEAGDGEAPIGEAWDEFEAVATPSAVLAQIVENERLQEAHEQICTNYNQVSYASEERGKQIDQLKAENAELGRYLCTCRDCGGEGSLHTGDWHSYSPMEPPEPVMEKCGECDGTGLIGEIQDLYQVITERDQLKAENEALASSRAKLAGELSRLRAKHKDWSVDAAMGKGELS